MLFLPTLHPFLTCTSEGVIAYYWSQFDIPVEDLEVVPEFSEERVLETLENGIKEQRGITSRRDIKISEVTASCRYHQGQMGGRGQTTGQTDWDNWVFTTAGSRI